MYLLRLIINATLKISVLLTQWLRRVWHNGYLLSAVVEGFWLGILPSSTLKKTIAYLYKISKKYHTDAHAMSGLFDWEEKLFTTFVDKKARVTIIGAGNGREAFALTKLGYSVEAFEMNKAYVDLGLQLGRQNGIDFRFEYLPEGHIPAVSVCDVFLIGWGAYTHMMGVSNRVNYLKSVRTILNDGGMVILSFWVEKRDDKYLRTIKLTSKIVMLRSIEDGESIFARFWAKYFTHQQIEEEAKMAGFRLLYIDLKPYGHAVLVK